MGTNSIPRVGMLATIRNRRGVLTAVDPFDAGAAGRFHRVRIEFADGDGESDQDVVWELEPNRWLVEPAALPQVRSTVPMPHRQFDAVVRAARWGAVAPFADPDGQDGAAVTSPIVAPFHSAVQVEDFQLVPLIKALRMPRIALLLADDVGLGKTVEAGLILSELLVRRRVQRVLVLCPASLQSQWQSELRDKFSLDCEIVDRDRTHQLRRKLGMDANPWRSSPRLISSYHYFKQPDVIAEFNAAFKLDPVSGQLPWDLLIVDEAHNLSPAAFGEDSDLVKMLRQVSQKFEHRLFLTATPHNGHTRCFSGMLEMLDPVRFTQTDEFSPSERQRIEDVLVRRLKREINQRTNPPQFADRLPPEAINLRFGSAESSLMAAFDAFRSRVRSVIASSARSSRLAGWFAVEILGKRLLSCPVAFSESWARVRMGLEAPDIQVSDSEVLAVERSSRDEIGDDREAEGRLAHASSTVGSWLRPLAPRLAGEIAAIDSAVAGLGLSGQQPVDPKSDARVAALLATIDVKLRQKGAWRDDERMVVFTEYKTTLDYLHRTLLQKFGDQSRLVTLYGGMESADREAVKAAFNDPRSPVRLLLATDAASEGLNLQETARYVLHFDVPWNPARLEQRNGRLDRHGQARDVSVFHFASDDDADLKFLAHVVRKVDAIREDLGATGEVFDEAIRHRLIEGESSASVQRDLDLRIDRAKGRSDVPRDSRVRVDGELAEREAVQLDALAGELDLDPESLRDTLEVSLGVGTPGYQFDADDRPGRVRFRVPLPSQWEPTIDGTVRRPGIGRERGPLPGLVFDANRLVEDVGGRPVFRPRKDTVLMHLSHPLFQRAIATLARARFPGDEAGKASRWCVRRTALPKGHTAHILLTIEELAINELREPFHQWTRTIVIPVKGDQLVPALPHQSALALRLEPAAWDDRTVEEARSVWSEVEGDIRKLLRERATDLTTTIKDALTTAVADATKRENDRFASRQGEISVLIQRQSLQSLEAEIGRLKKEKEQGLLFDGSLMLDELDRSIQAKEEELRRRRGHYEELREQLKNERDRVINRIIPRRFALRGDAQVFPVAVEIRLPGGKHA